MRLWSYLLHLWCCQVGTIIRSLNIYPSEKQLQRWIHEIEEEEPTGCVLGCVCACVRVSVCTCTTWGQVLSFLLVCKHLVIVGMCTYKGDKRMDWIVWTRVSPFRNYGESSRMDYGVVCDTHAHWHTCTKHTQGSSSMTRCVFLLTCVLCFCVPVSCLPLCALFIFESEYSFKLQCLKLPACLKALQQYMYTCTN